MFKLAELLEKTQESTSDVFELLADNEKIQMKFSTKYLLAKLLPP